MCIRWADQWRELHVWVEQFLIPAIEPGTIVVLDNLGSHKGSQVRKLVKAVGSRIFFLPPYSPDLNPIEQMFSKTVCPLLHRGWLALHCAAEGCSGWPSRSSSQEDEPWRTIQRFSLGSMWQSCATRSLSRMADGAVNFDIWANSTPMKLQCVVWSSGLPTDTGTSCSAMKPGRPATASIG